MDSSRLFHLLVISLFAAAIALIGLHELSHRFIKAGMKEGDLKNTKRLIKELSGERNILNPLAGRPTPHITPVSSGPSGGEVARDAITSEIGKVVDKLLPKN